MGGIRVQSGFKLILPYTLWNDIFFYLIIYLFTVTLWMEGIR